MEDHATTGGLPSTEVRTLPLSDPFFERVREINDLIARRAFELFEANGCAHGHDREDWLRAESEILHPLPLIVIETETELTFRAKVPGFNAKDIEVRVEPHSLLIVGKRQEASEQTRGVKTVDDARKEFGVTLALEGSLHQRGNTLYAERQSNLIFRVLDLPMNVDPERVKATLSDGLLEVTLSKVMQEKKIPVLVRAASA